MMVKESDKVYELTMELIQLEQLSQRFVPNLDLHHHKKNRL